MWRVVLRRFGVELVHRPRPAQPPVSSAGAWLLLFESRSLTLFVIPSEATRERIRARVRSRKESLKGAACSEYRGSIAPASASLRAARNAPTTAGPVPPPRKKRPLKIPSPTPVSSSLRAAAAALTFGELVRAKPAPTPTIPTATR